MGTKEGELPLLFQQVWLHVLGINFDDKMGDRLQLRVWWVVAAVSCYYSN